jgi:hypothetical protein
MIQKIKNLIKAAKKKKRFKTYDLVCWMIQQVNVMVTIVIMNTQNNERGYENNNSYLLYECRMWYIRHESI